MQNLKPAIAIIGPTASGKSRLGVELAQMFQGEVVSCDALQVYRRLDVGTAKITAAERAGVSHHLLDVAEPDREFSAGDYQRQARMVIRAISARQRLPLVVGGSGFYLRALIDGLFTGPERSEAIRERLRAVVGRRGPQALHRLLRWRDPRSAARIAAADTDRLIRACEVYLSSGKTMSWWQSQPRDVFAGYRWRKIGIDLPRELLYERINRRVERMFAAGLVEETRQLLAEYTDCPAFKAIGYRQAAAYLRGALTLREAIDNTQMESRRYAKRQLTWFRADREIIWLRPEPAAAATSGMAEALFRQAAATVRAFLSEPPL